MDHHEGIKKSHLPVIATAAGAVAGGIEAISVWPMENIKTQIQLQSTAKGVKPPFTGMIGGLTYTIRTTGFLSLYRGLTVTLVGAIPKAGIGFGANNVIKRLLGGDQHHLSMTQQFIAGVGAGTIEAIFVLTPIETIKTKLIETNQAFIPGVRSIIKESGFAGLYQGLLATILKQSSNQGLRFMFFNKYKDIVTENDTKHLTPVMALLGGMAAGCFSTIGNNPIDVVKTQMQGKNAKRYSSTFDCFVKIWKEEGLRGYFKGVVPRMWRSVPGQGIIFMSFESIQEFLEKITDSVFK